MSLTTWTKPRARTMHYCEMCARVIQPGETYIRGRGVDDGRWWSSAVCKHCDQLAQYVIRVFDLDDGCFAEDIHEWEPESVEHLRVKAQWLRGWAAGVCLRGAPKGPARLRTSEDRGSSSYHPRPRLSDGRVNPAPSLIAPPLIEWVYRDGEHWPHTVRMHAGDTDAATAVAA